MFGQFDERLARIENAGAASLLSRGRTGIEKESLRVTANNRPALTPHPAGLGAALTHPHITTDYSEAQLEFVTPPFEDVVDALAFLDELHRFTVARLDDEILWATSMPCAVSGEESVPIARFGTSHLGRFKYIYRRGLEARYRRIMQIISGVHFNYSVAEALWPVLQALEHDPSPAGDFVSDGYFALARNALRYDWLITYLFGSSPAVCKSFLDGLPHQFEEFDAYTVYEPYATSLRLSDIGYKNQAPALMNVTYNSLDAYVNSLYHATRTHYPPYEALGLFADGEYRQLTTNVLQIENEYYGSLRPKQIAHGDERPLAALGRRGVAYVELRSLDVNAYAPLGIDDDQARFLEAYLLFCLLQESPQLDIRAKAEYERNQRRVAHEGRRPGLKLEQNGVSVPMTDWALALLDRIAEVAWLLDGAGPNGAPVPLYARAVTRMRAAVLDPDATPSARMLAGMRATGEPFYMHARRLSEQHNRDFRARPLDVEREQQLVDLAEKSHARQAAIEAADTGTFEEYRARYFSQTPSGVVVP